MMSHLVFLPVYPELPEGALDRLAGAVEEVGGVGTELESRGGAPAGPGSGTVPWSG